MAKHLGPIVQSILIIGVGTISAYAFLAALIFGIVWLLICSLVLLVAAIAYGISIRFRELKHPQAEKAGWAASMVAFFSSFF